MPTLTRQDFAWDRADVFANRAAQMQPSAIREFLKVMGRSGVISFAGGIPDPALFPIDAIAQAATRITMDPDRCREALQYAPSEGHEPLREWIVAYMARLGVSCTVDNIVITAGSQQGLDLLGKLFLDRGDAVIVTAPTYLGALQAFRVYEPSFVAIDPVAPSTRHDRRSVRLAYLIPDFANPTGETLSRVERERLLDEVAELEIPIIEDAAYQALRYEGEPVPPLLALDIDRVGHIDGSRVIYAGTFSKTVAPGLRVGWICAARSVVQNVVLARQAADLHSPTLDQAILHDVVRTRLDAQVRRLTQTYRDRRDVMLAALQHSMPEGTSWSRPQGGMFIWLTLPEGIDSRELLQEAVETEGIIFVPGTSFFADGSGERHIRLNFTRCGDATIIDGIERLGALVARHVRTAAGSAGQMLAAR